MPDISSKPEPNKTYASTTTRVSAVHKQPEPPEEEPKGGGKICLICIGLIVLVGILGVAASYIMDMDFNPVIDNNKTIELNGVTITVPESNGATVNDSATLDYYQVNTDGNYNLSLDQKDNFNTPGTSHEYKDTQNNVTIIVVNSSDAPYLKEFKDGEVVGSLEFDGRYFQQKKTIGDKVVLVWVYKDNGKGLSQKIINSARV